MERESAVEMIARCAAHSDGPQYGDLSAEQWAQITPRTPSQPYRSMANESLPPNDRGLTGAHRELGEETAGDGSRRLFSRAYQPNRPRASASAA
jgi:hypothetical protein